MGTVPIFLLLLVAVLAGCARQPPIACTMEAMACPDGSYVGRDPGANCAFKPCPGQKQGASGK
jgi:hypothetical protein